MSADCIWNMVVKDMQARNAVGTAKYGKPLTLGDGRRGLVDAYEELLDGAVYLKKAILEEEMKHKQEYARATACSVKITRLRKALEAAEKIFRVYGHNESWSRVAISDIREALED
jgi:hypothetical protein